MEGSRQSSLLRDRQFMIGLFGGIAIAAVLSLYVWALMNSPEEETFEGSSPLAAAVETAPVTNLAINTFELKKDAEICKENDKPLVYLFSTVSCPHCQWIKETFDRVAAEYNAGGKVKVYHFDVETGDDLLTAPLENQLTAAADSAYNEFSPEGFIPTYVFGCKYFRVGNGYEREDNLVKEEAEFRAVIDDLLKNN